MLSSSSGPSSTPSHANPHVNCLALVCTSWWQHYWSLMLPVHESNRKPDTNLLALPVRFPAQQATSHTMFWIPVRADWIHLPLLPPVLCAKPAWVCLPRIKLHTAEICATALRLLLVRRIDRLKVRNCGLWYRKLLIGNVIWSSQLTSLLGNYLNIWEGWNKCCCCN